MTAHPRILILYTGGTIGMKPSRGGFVPSPGYLEILLAQTPKFRAPGLPRYTIEEFSPLLDSADIAPEHWLAMARAVTDNYDRFDGFIILHGTDTMAYTASALSFMLENLAKPVILTGSQLPMASVRSDGEANLLGALMILSAHHRDLGEVFVYFNNALFRGNRVTKSDADAFNAFSSPNFPTIAAAGVTIELDRELLLPRPEGDAGVAVVEMGHARVAALRIFPGIRAAYLETVLSPPLEGVVLECFGAGNVPSRNRPLIDTIADAVRRGVVVIAITQSLRGTADLTLYATGQALEKAGAVSGYDMTCEAALTKLYYLFAKGLTPLEVGALAGQSLRGELTPPESRTKGVEQIRKSLGAMLSGGTPKQG